MLPCVLFINKINLIMMAKSDNEILKIDKVPSSVLKARRKLNCKLLFELKIIKMRFGGVYCPSILWRNAMLFTGVQISQAKLAR